MARKPTYKKLEQSIRELEKSYSKRKRTKHALGEFLEFKEKIISESPIGMSIYDASGRCVAANDAIGELIGATKEQVLEQNYNNIESWKKSGMLDKAKSAIRENSKKRHELIVRSTFGKDVSLDCHIIPFSSGGQNHLLLMINDISECIRAEEALRESEEKYRTLIEMAHDAIIIGKGSYLDYNKASLDLFGCSSREQIYGKTPLDFSPPTQPDGSNSKEKSKQIVEKALVGEPQKFYWRHRKLDGTSIETEVSLNRIKVKGDFLLLGIIRDITERKQAEETLQKAHEQLERRVEERTAELVQANKKLQAEIIQREEVENELLEKTRRLKVAYEQSIIYAQQFNKEMAERRRAEEALFTSHEKLRSLASELSLAEERQRRQVAIEVHDRISQNLAFVKMKLGTLRASTTYSRIAGTMDEVLKLIDEIIQNTRSLISELGSPILYELGFVPAVDWLSQQVQRQQGIVVDFEDDGQPKPLSEDLRVLLFQAARELLINIVKHAKARTAKVSIVRDGDQIRVDVEDDGVGFDSEKIISSVDTTGRFGLFSIRMRLEPLGGHMEVDSKPGHGTRVTLVAPLKHNGENKKKKVS